MNILDIIIKAINTAIKTIGTALKTSALNIRLLMRLMFNSNVRNTPEYCFGYPSGDAEYDLFIGWFHTLYVDKEADAEYDAEKYFVIGTTSYSPEKVIFYFNTNGQLFKELVNPGWEDHIPNHYLDVAFNTKEEAKTALKQIYKIIKPEFSIELLPGE